MLEIAVGVGAFLLLALVAGYFVLAGPSKSEPTVTMSVPDRPALREFKVAELAPFTGENGSRIYVGVDGVVFDMSSHEGGPAFYGPGGGYSCFAGKDATYGLATMTVDSTQWKNVHVNELSAAQRDTVSDWVNRFRAKYTLVGSLTDGAHPTTLQQLKERGLLS